MLRRYNCDNIKILIKTGGKVMNMIIIFDRKSLVIPNADYEIFKKENYYIDDGTIHFFSDKENSLVILDANKKPKIAIRFNCVKIENENKYEIISIKYKLDKEINPQKDIEDAQMQALLIIKEVFLLFDDILKKRNPAEISSSEPIFKYYIRNKEKHIYDLLISLQGRFSYMSFLTKIDFVFGIE